MDNIIIFYILYFIFYFLFYIMPRKLENGTYEFKGGCIGEKGIDGKYKLISSRKKVKLKPKQNTKTTKIQGTKTNKRRSHKKIFKKKSQKGGGGANTCLSISVKMLRDFYNNNMKK